VADGWCWFVLREKYCWLVADKPNEQGADFAVQYQFSRTRHPLYTIFHTN
jgi:hypothetical protein